MVTGTGSKGSGVSRILGNMQSPEQPDVQEILSQKDKNTAFNPSTQRGRGSSRPAWITELAPGQPGLFYRQTLSRETIN